jgi:hypothetical protein
MSYFTFIPVIRIIFSKIPVKSPLFQKGIFSN